MTLAVVRTVGVMDSVVGGWSAMLRVFLEHLFLGDLGLATVGLPLKLSQQAPVMRFLQPPPTFSLTATASIMLTTGVGLRASSLVWFITTL